VITADHLADSIGARVAPAIPPPKPDCAASLRDQVRDQIRTIEREAVLAALDQAGGNKTEAARVLGIDYKTYRTKLKLLREWQGAPGHD